MNRHQPRFLTGFSSIAVALALFLTGLALPAAADSHRAGQGDFDANADNSFSPGEVLDAGHQFFGTTSRELAQAIEHLFSKYGRPNGYILGEEGSGAIVAGLRYGEGTLYTRNQGNHKIYWQGPSLGWDFGGDGGRTMILVYNLYSTDDMYNYYVGVNGSAYFIGGVGLTVLSHENVFAAPIRTGVGFRLGASVGYLKFTRKPTWNPF